MKERARSFVKSIWFFPSLVLLVLFILTALGISGSSVGIYDTLLGKQETKNLLAGEPRGVRSDEWLVDTPMTLAQVNNNFSVVNDNIGDGQDMSVVLDVPYAEWSVLLKPQTLGFFVMPADNAFALKWWSLAVVLILAVYFFVLAIFPRRRFIAITLSIFMLFSPFIQWWYRGITILPIAYGLIIATMLIHFLRSKGWPLWKKIAWSSTLSYVVACFIMVMYPPFQIPVIIAIVIFMLAYYFAIYKFKHLFQKWRWVWVVSPIIVALTLIGIFLVQHHEAVSATLNTVYPGDRKVLPGTAPITNYLAWPLSFSGYSSSLSAKLGGNSSEASRFLFIGLLLLPFLLFTTIKNYLSKKTIDNRLLLFLTVGTISAAALFTARMFVPIGAPFYNLIGLGGVPHERLLIAFGVLNIFALMITIALPFKRKKWFRAFSDFKTWSALIIVPVFVAMSLEIVRLKFGLDGLLGAKEILLVSVIIGIIVAGFVNDLRWPRIAGLSVMLFYSVASCIAVNPLQKGLAPITDTSIVQTMDTVDSNNPDARWAFSNLLTIQNLPVANSKWSLSTVYVYPQNKFWERYMPNADTNIYNRYAHVIVNIDDNITKPNMHLVQGDVFTINVSSCDTLLSQLGINYLASGRQDGSFPQFRCFEQKKPVNDIVMLYKRIN